MKAAEVLRRYAAGERNFRGANLRGQSFKGADLSGADFSEADIRSTNFTGANLLGVNFTGAKAGLQKQWEIFCLLISWFIGIVSGFFFAISGVMFLGDLRIDNNDEAIASSLMLFIIVLIFFYATISKDLVTGIGYFVGATAIFFGVAGPVADSVAFTTTGTVNIISAVVFAIVFAIAVIFTGAVAVIFTGAVAVTIAGTVAIAITFAVVKTVIGVIVGVIAVVIAVAHVLLSIYIGWRAINGNEQDAWIRNFAIAFAANRGTNFQNTNLTNAIFTKATLKNTDFRKAILTGTYFHNAKNLDLVRPGTTYLKNLKLQKWLTRTGKDKNFDRQDLRGVNLQGKILTGASFIGANLSEANLQDVDLSGAKLVQTQLDGTDLTGATLTGAFIEDWGITSSTVLNGVKCEYVYMHLPTKEDPTVRRKPDNHKEVFRDGDFKDFIKPFSDTLDLYHNYPVDPRAIALSWKKLVEKYPNADLEFASMEVRGEKNLLIRLKTILDINKSQLSAEYFQEYNRIKALNEEYIRQLINQGQQIRLLVAMVSMALQSPRFDVKGDYVAGDKIDQSRTQIISDSNINNSGAAGFSLGDIDGKVVNETNQRSSNLED